MYNYSGNSRNPKQRTQDMYKKYVDSGNPIQPNSLNQNYQSPSNYPSQNNTYISPQQQQQKLRKQKQERQRLERERLVRQYQMNNQQRINQQAKQMDERIQRYRKRQKQQQQLARKNNNLEYLYVTGKIKDIKKYEVQEKKNEIKKDTSENKCVICYEQDAALINKTCFHLCICQPCLANMKNSGKTKCPICRVQGDYHVVYKP